MKPGKPITPEEKEIIIRPWQQGYKQTQISREIKRSNAAVCQALAGIKRPKAKPEEGELFEHIYYCPISGFGITEKSIRYTHHKKSRA